MAIPLLTPTQDAKGARVWVYPKQMGGPYKRIHRVTSLLLHLFLFVTPWISIGGYPALHIDLPARQVWVLGTLFTASDGVLLMLMGLMAAFCLFFFTSMFGRLWCGYACPQSVFMLNWVFPIEEWIEGKRSKRMRRDRGEKDFDWAWRKAAKFGLFAGIAFLLSMSFMGFFSRPADLWTLNEGAWDYGIVGFFTAVWFFDFSYFREQVCNLICPYARFQSALMDDQSLVITYDSGRGDPRGGGKLAAKEGRCLDCNWCVDVCPQGIDIRDGFQLECIACGKCADACAAVHEKAGGKFESLVAYGTIAELEERPRHWIRGRTVLYATLLTALLSAFVGVLSFRAPFQATVNRAPGTLFVVDDEGYIRNTFLVRITNTDPEVAAYSVTVDGLDGVELTVPLIELQSTETRMVPLVLRYAHDKVASRTYPITVQVRSGAEAVSIPTTFKTPGPRSDS